MTKPQIIMKEARGLLSESVRCVMLRATLKYLASTVRPVTMSLYMLKSPICRCKDSATKLFN